MFNSQLPKTETTAKSAPITVAAAKRTLDLQTHHAVVGVEKLRRSHYMSVIFRPVVNRMAWILTFGDKHHFQRWKHTT